MNPLIPLFVIIPLAAAFLIMIIGRLIRDFNKYFTSLVLLLLVCLTLWSLLKIDGRVSVYMVGGWEPDNYIPIGIYMVLDSFNIIILCIITIVGFLSAVYSISYIKRYTSENYFYSL